MNIFRFNSAAPLQYKWSGKFKAPSEEWIHLTRHLVDFELIVVTEGVLYIANHEKEYVVEKGQYLLMSPTVHQHGSRSSDCTFYWMHFVTTTPYDTLQAENYEAKADAVSITIPEYGILESMERIIILMKQLQDSDRRYGMDSLNNFLTSAILAEISAQSCIHDKYYHSADGNQLFNDMVDYINWHISESLKVADVAEYFGYNEKYLSTLFRKWAKVSLKQYILQEKMERAKAELTDTNHSISQIGYSIGYNDPHNFASAFKKVTGLTPSEFRESYSKRRLVYR